MKPSILSALPLLLAVATSAAPVELWKAGDFAAAAGGAEVREGELVLPTPQARCSRAFKLKPEWRKLRLVGEMRTDDVPEGKASWQTARFALEWRDANGAHVSPWPQSHGWTGTTPWRKVEKDYLVPTNATELSLSLCNLTSGGTVRFRNVALSVVRDRPATRENAPPPAGVTDPESLEGAFRTASATRTSYSLNGIWRCRPAFAGETGAPKPDDIWSWARVPGRLGQVAEALPCGRFRLPVVRRPSGSAGGHPASAGVVRAEADGSAGRARTARHPALRPDRLGRRRLREREEGRPGRVPRFRGRPDGGGPARRRRRSRA